MLFCAALLNICLFLLYPYFDNLPFMSVLLTHRCKFNGIWCDCHTSERFNRPFSTFENAFTKSGICQLLSIRLKMCVLSFDFAIWLGTFRFEFSLEFSIFVILLFKSLWCLISGQFYIQNLITIDMTIILRFWYIKWSISTWWDPLSPYDYGSGSKTRFVKLFISYLCVVEFSC